MDAWHALLGDLDEAQRTAALEHLREVEAAAAHPLMQAGELDPALLYVLQGKVAIVRDGTVLDTSGPGEVIGEMALFRNAPRVASVTAVEPTRALVLDKGGFQALVAANHPVVFHLERIILAQQASRLRRLDTMVADHAPGSPDPWFRPPPSWFQRLAARFAPTPDQVTLVPEDVDVVEALQKSPLFSGELASFVAGLSRHFLQRTFVPGQPICQQGDPGRELFIVAEGKADVVVHVTAGDGIHRLGQVGPGDAVGLVSVADGLPRAASVIATEKVEALSMAAHVAAELVDADSQVASALRRALIRAFADQIDEAGQHAVKLG